jgi:hypothetical protein
VLELAPAFRRQLAAVKPDANEPSSSVWQMLGGLLAVTRFSEEHFWNLPAPPCFAPRFRHHAVIMRTRSHSKAFRNAILWTWWFPLFLATIAGGLRYSFDKDMPDEWIAIGKLSLTLPGGESPDDATIEAHISILESSALAKHAETRAMEAHSELRLLQFPEDNIMVTRGNAGLLHATAIGPDSQAVQAFLNEGMDAYITRVEHMRHDPTAAGAELNRQAVPMILELAGPAMQKRREYLLPVGLTAGAAGALGFLLTLLICSLWAFLRPASTQPSLEEIMKAAAGLDPMARSVLADWLQTQQGP